MDICFEHIEALIIPGVYGIQSCHVAYYLDRITTRIENSFALILVGLNRLVNSLPTTAAFGKITVTCTPGVIPMKIISQEL